MAVATKKRSLSDMQDLGLSSNEANQQFGLEDNYRMMVLQFENGLSEEDVDKHFLRMALNLGIHVPQDPKTTLDIVTSNVGKLTLASTSIESQPALSQSSQSFHPPSDSSSEQQYPTKTSSITTASIASVTSSFDVASSRKPSYQLIKQGIRRLSTLRRRRTIDAPIHHLPPYISSSSFSIPSSHTRSISTDPIQIPIILRKPVALPSYRAPPKRDIPSLPDRAKEDREALAASQRSLHNIRLQRLRTTQLAEQSRFTRFEIDQYRLMRLKQTEIKEGAMKRYRIREHTAQEKHIEALTSLENRHLSAEVDLCRTLQLEKQACETRLRHMEAYCNPKSKVDGMPNRVVTRRDYHQLTQQYHAHNGMDNLHAARINVLREKQAKQLERISAKQDLELDALAADLEAENAALDAKLQSDAESLQTEFSDRKRRLVARWFLAEAIERRKLENETGQIYGPLPALEWPDGTRERGKVEDETLEGFARDALMAYDAATLGMI